MSHPHLTVCSLLKASFASLPSLDLRIHHYNHFLENLQSPSALSLSHLPVKMTILIKSYSLMRTCSFTTKATCLSASEHIQSLLTPVLINRLAMHVSEAILSSCITGAVSFCLLNDFAITLYLSSITNFSLSNGLSSSIYKHINTLAILKQTFLVSISPFTLTSYFCSLFHS